MWKNLGVVDYTDKRKIKLIIAASKNNNNKNISSIQN